MDDELRRRGVHRVVEVWAGDRHGVSYGSGYAVADDLVLTARHVLDKGPPYRVRLFGDEREKDARVAWLPTGTLDAALLRVASSPWRNAPDSGALRWGRVGDSGVECCAHGFPRAQQRADGSREAETLEGRISRTTGALGGRYHVDITRAPPVSLGASASAWQGMSGAVLLGRGRELLGVVVEDPVMFGGRRLEAVSVSRLLDEPGFADLVRVYAHHVEEVHPWPEVRELDAWASGFLTPAWEDLDAPDVPDFKLLQPRHQRVGFVGREEQLGQLRRWWAGPEKFSVAVVTGDAGAGKTRLGIQLCREVTEQGWSAGFAGLGELARAGSTRIELVWPTLMVIDYPDGLTDDIGRLLARFAQPGRRGAPLRLLILDRAPGGAPDPRAGTPLPASVTWWTDLNRTTSGLVAHGTRDVIPLAAGRLRPPDRVTHARAALTAFGDGTVPAVLPDLSDEGYSNPLKVHLAVLLALRGQTSPTAAGTLQLFVARERARWQRRLAAHGIAGLGEAAPHHAVVLVTLTTPTREEAVELLTALDGFDRRDPVSRVRTSEWLQELFAGPGSRLAPLAPDLLAEQLLEDAGERLSPLVQRLYEHPARTPDHTVRMLDALQLAARQEDRRHVRTALHRLLAARLGTLVDEAAAQPQSQLPVLLDTAVERCASFDADRSLAAAAAAVRHRPPGPGSDRSVTALRRRVAALALAGYDARTDLTAGERAARVGLLTDLTAQHEALGEPGEATRHAERACAECAEDDPAARARVTYNLGTCLARGRAFRKALPWLQDAAGHYERLAARDPGHRPACADALINLALCHADLGQQAQAARALVRAMQFHDTGWWTEELRDLLLDLARRLDAEQGAGAASGAGDASDPLPEAGPGADGYCGCVGSDPARPKAHQDAGALEFAVARTVQGFGAHAPDRVRNALFPMLIPRLAANQARYLAFTQAEQLRVLAGGLARTGRPEVALAPAAESVALLRRFVVPAEPDKRWVLARGLGILADYSSQAGRLDDAIAYARQHVDERRALLPEDHAAYAPEDADHRYAEVFPPAPGTALASALGDLADLLCDAGRLDEAVGYGQEAVALYSELARRHPRLRPELGGAAAAHGSWLLQLGRPEEALDALRLAAGAFEELAAEDGQYAGLAAQVFTDLAWAQFPQERDGPARALGAARRAVELLGAAGEDERDEPAEAAALVCLGTALLVLDRTREAAEAARQAVALWRAAADGGDEAGAGLAHALSLTGLCHQRLNRHDLALATLREAEGVLAGLPVDNPVLNTVRGMALSALAAALIITGDPAGAEGAAARAVAAFDALEQEGGHAVTGPGRAEALVSLAQSRIHTGRPEEALDPLDRAAEDLRGYPADNPVVRAARGRLHYSRGLCLAGLGRPAEALRELAEAMGRPEDEADAGQALLRAEFLTVQGTCHTALGRPDVAAERLAMAVRLFAGVPADAAAAVVVPRARTLVLLAECLLALGDQRGAREAAEETLRLPAAASTTSAYAFFRAGAHLVLAQCGAQLGEPFGDHTDRCVGLLRALPEDPSLRPMLAKAVALQAVHLFNTALTTESEEEEEVLDAFRAALAVAQEAADRQREWPGEPEALAALGSMLHIAGACLSALDRPAEALDPLREATAVLRPLSDHPHIALELLGAVHRTALCHGRLGRHTEALEAYDEAVDLFTRPAEENPAAYAPQLLEVLDGRIRTLRELGRDDEAEAAQTWAARWRRSIT
ncbi:trypsin-like peptidase domain-containing protein [Streptomyces sp. TRM S81-3]|uniref:Trypsin-like peptidase domain-containing protein n=1 Tax=Streptomyces griseicoloratus TaxID=2752516 RepID=A0A926LBL3_9ACTN|nr:trypsin-like peptidase domain-containing protein [Streptomyces griseicoloratus]MBD0424564.1 trypsin-like peptidase domain-containing protein [Streptomyces griseicoloratus]